MITTYGERNNIDLLKSRFLGSKIKLENRYETYEDKYILPVGAILGFIIDKIGIIISHGKSLFIPISLTLLLRNKLKIVWHSENNNRWSKYCKIENKIIYRDSLFVIFKRVAKNWFKSLVKNYF